MKLYHRTTRDSAKAILAEGFKDSTDRYMTDREWTGVWLSARPLDFADGIPSDWVAILEITLPAKVVRRYEWEQPGIDREFLVPATVVNAAGRPRLTLDEL